MQRITWDTDVDAPCCPGQIVAADGRTILIQQDTDFPGVADTFGWSVLNVERSMPNGSLCLHDGTDGTVDCKECGVKSATFIASARDWLADHDGEEADDPGYFT